MWLIIIHSIKKYFSTDTLLQDAKKQCNEILIDLNRNIDRNISIVDGKIKTLSILIREANSRIKTLMEVEKKTLAENTLHNAVSSITNLANDPTKALKNISNVSTEAMEVASAAYKNMATTRIEDKTEENALLNIQDEVVISKEKKNKRTKKNAKNLPPTPSSELVKEEVQEDSLQDIDIRGDSLEAQIIRKIEFSDDLFSSSKVDTKEKVLSLSDAGYTVESIAQEVNLTITEVQLILSIEGRI